jgi:Fe-S-cluster-containing hydrogenase component 2
MEEDEEGFLYPKVDKEKCSSCELCLSVCKFKNRVASKTITPKAYAVQHLSSDVLAESTSGGAFTALSDFIINNGGVVYGWG